MMNPTKTPETSSVQGRARKISAAFGVPLSSQALSSSDNPQKKAKAPCSGRTDNRQTPLKPSTITGSTVRLYCNSRHKAQVKRLPKILPIISPASMLLGANPRKLIYRILLRAPRASPHGILPCFQEGSLLWPCRSILYCRHGSIKAGGDVRRVLLRSLYPDYALETTHPFIPFYTYDVSGIAVARLMLYWSIVSRIV